MYKQIAENKRRTIIIIVGFVVMIGAIAGLFAWFYNDVWVAVWTIAIAIVYAVIQYFASSSIAMAMTGAKEITKKDNPRFYNAVENLSITTGLPMPKVYIIEDKAPNAFATGRDPKHASVAATTGLIDIMDNKELTAVMAHEMSHIKNYDIRVSMIVFGLVATLRQRLLIRQVHVGLMAKCGRKVLIMRKIRHFIRNYRMQQDGIVLEILRFLG